ncbi:MULTISPECIES: tRNA 2-selenouridine(34) synthase MnmH [Planococcus]|uniref:tRNA 2-selenouridine(34) synthase MnmH n=1 Tax=Planococcus faecalis TaxID=1598147 RepID=A0ABN4XUF1_9BACL|nr:MULTISPECIES: tRNA 2-selenouridine(34) synthase MnmH [Planococcus]AQU80869.1 tRNA 2-selenouridine(34) synthase MnmH [Planococcus faecalis]MDJ0332212.1 tRNA 2-selenouridine(34) synthase MnmH [Planococcus sp. S3-L1]
MFSNISVNELMPLSEQKKMVLIDVRSPSEYKNFSIPGSINIPFFDDTERAEIGTLYKQASVEAAKVRGLEIISAKLPEFVQRFKQVEGSKTVFCWRGGMRSRTTATLLSLMDVHVSRLEGGIREYRRWVVSQLDQPEAPFKAYVLNGLTGTGKTRILKALEKQGYPVIDLEGLANHKGSIFGHIGVEPHNQKMFDSLLVQQCRELEKSPFILFEAESARIGKIVIPSWLTELKANSVQLIIDMPMEERIKEIIEDYRPVEYQAECIAAFQRIKTRMPLNISKQIEVALEVGEFPSAVRLLLEYYYDSRYQHTGLQYPDAQKKVLQVRNLEEAIEAIKKQIPKIEESPII